MTFKCTNNCVTQQTDNITLHVTLSHIAHLLNSYNKKYTERHAIGNIDINNNDMK